MFLVASLIPFFVLAITVAAHPAVIRDSLISLPIARHFNGSRTLDLVRTDRERAKSFVECCDNTFSSESGVDISATFNISIYTTSVGVGDPPTYCEFY
jgi:cathepsin E